LFLTLGRFIFPNHIFGTFAFLISVPSTEHDHAVKIFVAGHLNRTCR